MIRASGTPEEAQGAGADTALAGGVSASVRFNPYLGRPILWARGDGPYLYDVDGKEYVDFNVSNGACVLGHRHPAVREAVLNALDAGTIAGAETEHNARLARRLCEIIPSAERVRFASTGSEVTAVAVRLARHATGRDKLLKFDGHFHGLSDTFLYARDDHDPDTVVPSSGGVPASGAAEVVIVPWNAPDAFERALDRHRGEIAAVILEPVHFNAGCIPPEPGFLELVRARTERDGIVLIFDEVLSGFRVSLGGMQAYYGITPDLSTFAKAIANGVPLSALVGRADLMEQLAPTGPVAHSGTYSGHLHGVLAGLATLEEISRPGLSDQLREVAEGFYADIQGVFDRHAIPARVQGLGTRFGIYFGSRDPVRSIADARDHDHDLNRRFFLGCLERGVYFHPYKDAGPPGHAGFSVAHSDEVLDRSLEVMNDVAAEIAQGGHA
jgi:glutamate-1-semialdehyde 2,1-aminomutase